MHVTVWHQHHFHDDPRISIKNTRNNSQKNVCLFSASFMSAPAALAMSKLMCPEVEEPAVKDVDDIKDEKTEEKNLFEAVAVGASMSIGLVANIAVMLIAFLSLLAFVNGMLGALHTFYCFLRNPGLRCHRRS